MSHTFASFEGELDRVKAIVDGTNASVGSAINAGTVSSGSTQVQAWVDWLTGWNAYYAETSSLLYGPSKFLFTPLILPALVDTYLVPDEDDWNELQLYEDELTKLQADFKAVNVSTPTVNAPGAWTPSVSNPSNLFPELPYGSTLTSALYVGALGALLYFTWPLVPDLLKAGSQAVIKRVHA
jgi:hypothetical protein